MYFYTAGYAGWTPQALLRQAQELDAVVCDIRYQPFSPRVEWRKPNLMRLLGEQYVDVHELGNRNYRGGTIEIVDYARGRETVRVLLRQWPAVLLLCGCADLRTCHRLLVAELLSTDLGCSVTHLSRPSEGQQPRLFA